MFGRRHQKNDCKKNRNDSGYSLLEILIALSIIAALTAVVAPRLFGQVDRSKVVSTKAQAKQLKQTLQLLHLDIGRFPTPEEGLNLLQNQMGADDRWRGPYLDGELPVDAWGNAFLYSPPSHSPDGALRVYSLGADAAPGGSGINADVYG